MPPAYIDSVTNLPESGQGLDCDGDQLIRPGLLVMLHLWDGIEIPEETEPGLLAGRFMICGSRLIGSFSPSSLDPIYPHSIKAVHPST